MLASCAVDVKFHDWESSEFLGSVSSPDPKSKGFLDICWCNDGKYLIAVPICGKSLLICPYQLAATVANAKDEKWRPAKDVIDILGVKCASCSKVENANVAVGTVAGEVLLYNIYNKKVLQKSGDLPACANFIQYGAQDLFIAAGCSNGQIFLYGAGLNVAAAYFVPSSESLSAIAVHSKVPYLLSGGSEQGIVAVWDINTGNNILKSNKHSGSVVDMSFSTTDDTFTTIGSDQKINIYDLRTSECVHGKQFDADLTALAYCPNGTEIAVGTGRGQIISLDKRYLHASNNGLRAHKFAIKKICFENNYNAPLKISNTNNSKSSIEIDFLEEDAHGSIVSNNEVKTPGSGDYSLNKNKVRFGHNICANSDKCSVGTSLQVELNSTDRTTFHIIDENCLNQFRHDIIQATKEIVNGLVETINNEFLKMRMGVSREFCSMEIRNKKRWQEFNMILLKIADLDEQENDDGSINNSSTSHKEHTVLSQVKTKISSNQYINSSKSVK